MVGTALDLNSVLCVLLEIETRVQAWGASILVAGHNETIACFGTDPYLLVGRPLVAGARSCVYGDGFGHVCVRGRRGHSRCVDVCDE